MRMPLPHYRQTLAKHGRRAPVTSAASAGGRVTGINDAGAGGSVAYWVQHPNGIMRHYAAEVTR